MKLFNLFIVALIGVQATAITLFAEARDIRKDAPRWVTIQSPVNIHPELSKKIFKVLNPNGSFQVTRYPDMTIYHLGGLICKEKVLQGYRNATYECQLLQGRWTYLRRPQNSYPVQWRDYYANGESNQIFIQKLFGALDVEPQDDVKNIWYLDEHGNQLSFSCSPRECVYSAPYSAPR